jgi:hypothetical protein
MRVSESRRTTAVDPDAIARTEELLDLYPNVSTSERDEIAHFLRKGAPIDIGFLSSNEQAWSKAERFKTENRTHFTVKPREYFYWGLLIIAVATAVFLLWDIQAR